MRAHWLELVDFGHVVWLDKVVDLGRVGVVELGIHRVGVLLVIGVGRLVVIDETFNNWRMVYLRRLVDLGVARNLGEPFILLLMNWEIGLIGVESLLVELLLIGVIRSPLEWRL